MVQKLQEEGVIIQDESKVWRLATPKKEDKEY